MLKKIGSFLLIAVMIMAIFTPITISAAASGQCGDNVFWVLDDSGTLIITGTGNMWDWGYTVPSWFNFRTDIGNVVISPGVTSIGSSAFLGCDRLTTISIPSSVTSIGYFAFALCDRLTTISIPPCVTSIGEYAFAPCNSLVAIFVDENNPTYCDVDGVLFSKDKKTIYVYPAGKTETSYEIPYGVTSIGYAAFASTGLKTISIPSGVTSIGNDAFENCYNLTTIDIPYSVTSIGNEAFDECCNLTSINIPYSVTSIGNYAFGCCENLADIYYGGSEDRWRALAIDADVPKTAKVHYNSAKKTGTIIGSALRTDITAKINGHPIPSFNVDGYTYIVAEDLKGYGFFVHYDDTSRTLAVNRDYSKTTVTRNYVKPYVAPGEVGIKEHDLVATDIVTYLDNNYVQSYNINGLTIIPFNDLGRYGAVYYDNATRVIKVTIPGLN